jgi:pimeloyl-ACP methyl ester carboxylesterase
LNVILLVFLIIIFLLFALVYLAPKAVTNFALKSERARSGLVRKEITLPNGLHYAYLEGGQGEPLVLLHGFGGNKDTFTRVSRYLTKKYKLIIPDIIGFGESSKPTDVDYSPSAQVERLRALFQALGIDNLHLGGNSMGGQIATIYTSLYPTEIKSLWLISPSGVWSAPKSHVIKEIIETGHNSLTANNVEEFKQVMALGMKKVPFIPKPMLTVLAQERVHNITLEEEIFKEILDCSIEKMIAGMNTKTLIVFGDKDRIIPAGTAEVLKSILPNSTAIILKNVGHVAMFEKPRTCARVYLQFQASTLNS